MAWQTAESQPICSTHVSDSINQCSPIKRNCTNSTVLRDFVSQIHSSSNIFLKNQLPLGFSFSMLIPYIGFCLLLSKSLQSPVLNAHFVQEVFPVFGIMM